MVGCCTSGADPWRANDVASGRYELGSNERFSRLRSSFPPGGGTARFSTDRTPPLTRDLGSGRLGGLCLSNAGSYPGCPAGSRPSFVSGLSSAGVTISKALSPRRLPEGDSGPVSRGKPLGKMVASAFESSGFLIGRGALPRDRLSGQSAASSSGMFGCGVGSSSDRFDLRLLRGCPWACEGAGSCDDTVGWSVSTTSGDLERPLEGWSDTPVSPANDRLTYPSGAASVCQLERLGLRRSDRFIEVSPASSVAAGLA